MEQQPSRFGNYRNKYFVGKLFFNVFCVILGALLMILFLQNIQNASAKYSQRVEADRILTEITSAMDRNRQDVKELTEIFHDGNQETLEDLSRLFTSGYFRSLEGATQEDRVAAFERFRQNAGVEYLFLMDSTGRIVMSPLKEFLGVNLLEKDLIWPENLEKLLATTANGEPVEDHNATGDYFFYSTKISFNGTDYYMVLGEDSSILQVQFSALNDIRSVIQNVAVGENGFIFAIDKETNTLAYYNDGQMEKTGMNVLECGFSEKILKDRYAGEEVIDGVSYYCVTRSYGDYLIISAAINTETMYAGNSKILVWSVAGFVLVMIICLLYGIVLRNDMILREQEADIRILGKIRNTPILFNRTILRRLLPVSLLGAMVVFGLSYYSQTILELSNAVSMSENEFVQLEDKMTKNVNIQQTIENYYNNRFLFKTNLLAYVLEEDARFLNTGEKRYYSDYNETTGLRELVKDSEGNPLTGVRESAVLQDLCNRNKISSIYVYDEQGRVLATNTQNWQFTLSRNPEDQSHEFLAVLDGRKNFIIQNRQMDDNGESNQYIATRFTYYTLNENGETRYLSRSEYEATLGQEEATGVHRHEGMVQIGLQTDLMERLTAANTVEYMMSNSNIMGSGFLMAFTGDGEHKVLFSPDKADMGKSAEKIGITEKAFSGNYNGFTRLNGESYFQCVRFLNGYYIASAIPSSVLYRNRLGISLTTGITSLVFILLMSGLITLSTRKEEEMYLKMARETMNRDGNGFLSRYPARQDYYAKWNGREPWNQRKPEQKLWTFVKIGMAVFVLYMFVIILGAKTYFGENSIIFYIFSGRWERNLNIFAFSACAAVIIFTTVFISLLDLVAGLITSVMGKKTETIGHLILSVVKYGSTIGILFYCLYLLGLDAQSLVASAGILSLVVGLGAQSLISDILAGVFIVFEGEFRVGDYVTIGDYRGKVLDIGLRTTKVMDDLNNIKIFNNSTISGVMNMTKDLSIVYNYLSVPFDEDINRLERIITKEFTTVCSRIPALLDVPTFDGVQELKDSSIQVRVSSRCREEDTFMVRRAMNRELLRICDVHDIVIPYNAVIVMPERERRNTQKQEEE